MPPTPDSPTADETLGEIATILAAGLLRLRSRKSSPNLPVQGENLLDCKPSSGGDVAGDFQVSRP